MQFFHFLYKGACMNKRLIVMLLCCLPVLAVAEPETDEAQKTDWTDKRVARLTKELNLNAEQQTKVKSIFESQRDKIKAIREETHASLKAVFTPEQQAKFEKIREEREKMREERRQQHHKKMMQ